MAIPTGAVLVKDFELRPKVFRVTLCMNHLSYGKYDAYEQPGGMAYKLYPARGYRLHHTAPKGKMFASIHDFATGYAYY